MKYTFPEDCIEITITFTPLCVIADSPARATLQNKVRHNGSISCPYCFIFGFYVNAVRFPFVQSQCEQRTHTSHVDDVNKAILKGATHRGVKGPSSFSDFINIDMIRSFSRDSMHGGILCE